MRTLRGGRAVLRVGVLFGIAALPALAQGRAPESVRPCSVEGQVVDAQTNAPVRKASITLKREGDRTVRRAALDAGGVFRFDNLPAGEYSLAGEARGYLPLTTHSPGQTRRSATSFSLKEGQKLSGLVMRLTPFGAVSGRVVDEDGEPLERVDVLLLRISYETGMRKLTRADTEHATTDDRGVYRIRGVAPGRYYLMASASGPGTPGDQRYVRTYYPGTLDPGGAAPIHLGPGAEVESINFKLSKVQTVRVSGRVRSAAAAMVTLYPNSIEHNVFTGAALENIMKQTSPGDGRFEFEGVVPGDYNLQVGTREGGCGSWALRTVTVGMGGAEGVTLTPSPCVSVTGRVRVEGGGGAMDFSKVALELWPMYLSASTATPQTDGETGTFRAADLPPGRYKLMCPRVPAGFYLKSVRTGNGELAGRILDLAAGSAPIEVVLSAKAASVTGKVLVAGSGTPAAEVIVVLVPQEKERKDDVSSYVRGTTDESGRFTIGSVPPGSYRAFAWETVDLRKNVYMDPDFMAPLESQGVSVAVSEGGQAEVELTCIR